MLCLSRLLFHPTLLTQASALLLLLVLLTRAMCRYDGTVRNSAGDVVQFLYGEDGMDGVRIEGQVSS